MPWAPNCARGRTLPSSRARTSARSLLSPRACKSSSRQRMQSCARSSPRPSHEAQALLSARRRSVWAMRPPSRRVRQWCLAGRPQAFGRLAQGPWFRQLAAMWSVDHRPGATAGAGRRCRARQARAPRGGRDLQRRRLRQRWSGRQALGPAWQTRRARPRSRAVSHQLWQLHVCRLRVPGRWHPVRLQGYRQGRDLRHPRTRRRLRTSRLQ